MIDFLKFPALYHTQRERQSGIYQLFRVYVAETDVFLCASMAYDNNAKSITGNLKYFEHEKGKQ